MSDSDIARQLQRLNLRIGLGEVIERPLSSSGTFTPAYEGTGTAGSWTYSVQAGFYTRIGNRCFFNLSLTAATRPGAPTGNGVIVGLPFTSDATTNSHSAVTLDTIDAVTLGATNVMLTARIPPNTTRIDLIEVLGTAPTVAGFLAATGLSATATIRVAGHYMIA